MEQYIEIRRYHETVREGGHDNCRGLVDHLQSRVDSLVRENEELRQKTQIVVKKVETNIVEKRPGLDQETAQKITELERRLSEAELIRDQKIREIESLEIKVVKFNDLRGELDVFRNRNQQLELQLNEKIRELDALRLRITEFSELRDRDQMIIAERDRDLMELRKRLQALETLPNQLAAARRSSETLSVEIDRLTISVTERDHEMELLHKKIRQFESLQCINPSDHDELRARLRQIETLEAEFADLKSKYISLCNEYEKEIAIVRAKDKEIDNLSRSLHQNIKEAREAIDKEISLEERMEREVEILSKKLEERRLEIEEWKRRASLVPDLENKLKHLESEFFKLQDRCKRLEEINSQYVTKIEAFNVEISTLRGDLKNRERLFAELEREKLALIAEFEKSQKESSFMIARVTEKKNAEIEALNIKMANLSQELIALQRNIDGLKGECDRLNSEKMNIQKALQEHTAQERDLFARVEALRKEKELLGREITGLADEKRSLKSLAISKDKEAHVLDQNLHDLANENNRLKGIIADLEKKWASHSHLLQEREVEIRSLKESLQSITYSKKELVVERDRLLSENSHLVHKVTELETSMTKITVKYDKLEKIYNEIRGATAQLDKVHDKLVETCVETEKISHQKVGVIQEKTHMKEEIYEQGARRF